MQRDVQRVLELQPFWSAQNTTEMDERGKLIRGPAPTWLRTNDAGLSDAIGIPVADFIAEGRDGTGRKTRVPWVRFGSRERSPNATDARKPF
jgi:hypothetical protein